VFGVAHAWAGENAAQVTDSLIMAEIAEKDQVSGTVQRSQKEYQSKND